MAKLKKVLIFCLIGAFLAACGGTPRQTWQPKPHPPVNKKKR